MSVDTRTPRTTEPSGRRPGEATGGRARGFFDDEPVLSTVKVPSDPAQVVVNHASFRVQLASPPPRSRALTGADGLSAVRGAVPVARRRSGRRAPVVWSGRTAPGDARATRLLQAVRHANPGYLGDAGDLGDETGNAATQVLPRVLPGTAPGPAGDRPTRAVPAVGTVLDDGRPTIISPRAPQPPERPLLAGVRPAEGAYDVPEDEPYEPYEPYGAYGPDDGDDGGVGEGTHRHHEPVRHGYYPGRRMNLGVVLLPLRIFLGFISVYAGMGKLCDPVYFDGGERGSLVGWLRSLRPWAVAEPLRDFAIAHPVGAGLSVAFLQIVVGVLTVMGLWQRVAAGVGALLSAALIVTVSWRTVPVYDAPDIIYLAAWSPLVIAGAPYYSLDARLAGEAWRKLGPRVEAWELRRRVLRRGTVVATLVLGLTLLVGAVLGSAVRSARVATVPEPGEPLTNNQPGSPLPRKSEERPSPSTSGTDTGRPSAATSAVPGPSTPSAGAAATPGTGGTGGGSGEPGTPSQRQTVQAPSRPDLPAAPEPGTPSVPDGTGGTGEAGTGGGTGGGEESGDGTGGGDGDGALGGLLG
ncbi:MAG TPA: DoxX family protein [Streptomyces sp.]|uniref:DoxX family protein n=1 Tax=Streptomyces sp. TaxID=1931 RepID=UPI002D607411|nr:DoxX family protein [Streptomyces sp.]HZG06510.1 DoxX family protein [Streptomyces sp.]